MEIRTYKPQKRTLLITPDTKQHLSFPFVTFFYEKFATRFGEDCLFTLVFSNTAPKSNTKVYFPPLFNIYQDKYSSIRAMHGSYRYPRVCLSNFDFQSRERMPQNIDDAITYFWGSDFQFDAGWPGTCFLINNFLQKFIPDDTIVNEILKYVTESINNWKNIPLDEITNKKWKKNVELNVYQNSYKYEFDETFSSFKKKLKYNIEKYKK